ncbi:hypothetical protein DID88_009989 [Monilinia fructigena]|uniref:protein-serine/threonine phosphatase n=1 Tax=Monilinia fructigena TaxID=38457 RepID=A0A395IKK2_9HELO|nr:hypothetical protein DID88_009989 [Monilinia fructigena]
MPRLKSKVLDGCVIVMSGLVPLGVDLMRSEIAQQIESFGGKIHKKVSRRVTHVVASSQKTLTQQWLTQSISKWKKEDESEYLVDINPADRRRAEYDESGTESDASFTSNTSRASQTSSKRGHKRRLEDAATDEDDSDEESTMAKKQRIANSRTTGLKTVKTPTAASESSLLTPGITGDENEEADQLTAQEESDHSFEEDLEAEMEAAFEQELADEAAAAVG